MKKSMDRQSARTALIIISFVLMPVTFAYISCPIIIEGASKGIATGGLIVFILIFTSSLFVGRLWCGWLCPAGGLQDIYFRINNKNVHIGILNWLKYVAFLSIIFIPLISAIHSSGGLKAIDLFYHTDYGISIAREGAYVIYVAAALMPVRARQLSSIDKNKRIFILSTIKCIWFISNAIAVQVLSFIVRPVIADIAFYGFIAFFKCY